jgi:hypothetical protein
MRSAHWCVPLASLLAASAMGVPVAAVAQERQDVLEGKHKIYESPQHFAFEVRFSPFTPDIDSDPTLGGKTPYADAFGTSPQLLFAAEFDWQAARIPHVGTIGPGGSIGYTSVSKPAQFVTPQQGKQPGENTQLEIVPLYAVGVLRADALWREGRIPLVPYAKLGFGLSFWRASNTAGTSHYQGVSGLGHSLGTQVSVGLGLNLNVFDPYAARNLDETMGVNNTYVFADWTHSDLTGLWAQPDPLRVGGSYWTFGIAFEF